MTFEIIFFNNKEIINKNKIIASNRISKEELNEIGTFYFNILSNENNIINCLKECIKNLKNDTTFRYSFKNCIAKPLKSLEEIDSNLFYFVESNLRKKYLETIKRCDKYFSGDRKYVKSNMMNMIYFNYIRILEKHIIKFKYFYTKEIIPKETYSKNRLAFELDLFVMTPRSIKCLCYEKDNIIEPLSHIFEEFNENDFKTKEEYYKKIYSHIDNINIKTLDVYDTENFQELLDVYYSFFSNNKIKISKCKNCGKYFMPHNKQVYCDNPSPQNEKYTCRLLPDDMRNNKNPIYETYRNNYKTQSNKKRRNTHIPDIEKKFCKWNEEARNKMEECQKGNISLEEYKTWLKQSQNWIKSNI